MKNSRRGRRGRRGRQGKLSRTDTVADLKHRIATIDRRRESLVNDPMTEAMGAPVEDFMEGWDAEERKLLVQIMKIARRGSFDWEWAASRMERWMP